MKTLTGFQKGVNLGGWLSQCDYSPERLNGFITGRDFETIAAWGLDHVRLPMDYNIFEGGRDGFKYLSRAAQWAKENGLNLILDLHKTRGFSFDMGYGESGFFDSESYQEEFYALWEQIAVKFGDRPESIAFELLNEVTDKAYMPKWMEIAEKAVKRIRKLAPETRILLGGYWNNSVEAVPDLAKPFDSNIVYNFHCYDPLVFTHQHAPWVRHADVSRDVSYEESGATEAYFEDRFAPALKKAEEEGVPLYCGEYGVIENVPPEEALKWYRAIHSVFTAHGIGRAAWSYRRMNFGLSDEKMDGVRKELIKVL